jgi:DNA repair protein RecO (recombination protein O)
MPVRESEAIILRSLPLGEADRLVSFLSRTEGRLRGVASGARRTKSRFGSTLEIFSHIRIWFYERETRDLVRINQCELIESFLDVQRDYSAGLVLAVASEITEAVLGEREQAETHFRLLLAMARAVQAGAKPPLALAYFALWTIRLGGWLPRLERCAQCGAELGGAAYASERRGLVCANCRLPGQRVISAEALGIARRMLKERLDDFKGDSFSAPAVMELKEYMLDEVEHHAEKQIRARKMLDQYLEPAS